MVVFSAAFLIALLIGVAVVLTQSWHGKYSMDSTFGVQKIHTNATPRVGGVAILAGLVCGWYFAEPAVRAVMGPMLIAGLPAFIAGLAEDVTKTVGVRSRLVATMLSGVVAWYLTGVSMQDTGVAPLDWLLNYLPVAVLFTAFAVGGMANAINIIDGFNGLASGAVAIMVSAIGAIALNLGNTALASTCFVIAAASLGFGAMNWPTAKLFMGDGGAYLLGFCLAWVAVLLPMRHVEINAWATLLICIYPVLEVGFSVRRRSHREGRHPGQPDRVHLHHLVHRRMVRQVFPKLRPDLQNGLAGSVCWAFVLAPAALAVAFAQNTPALACLVVLFGFAYATLYARLSQFRWCFSPRTLQPNIAKHVA